MAYVPLDPDDLQGVAGTETFETGIISLTPVAIAPDGLQGVAGTIAHGEVSTPMGTKSITPDTLQGVAGTVSLTEPTFYTLTASSGANGSIDPTGDILVRNGEDQLFTFTPDINYHVDGVLVDNVSVGYPSTYLFESVIAPHTIGVSFAINQNTVLITQGSPSHGTVSPTGATLVNYGEDIEITVTPDSGWDFDEFIDGAQLVPVVNPYTFSNVIADHTFGVQWDAIIPPITDYYLRRWDGASWTSAYMMIWENGWLYATMKCWDGSQWVSVIVTPGG